MKAIVSIVTPTYNRKHTLPRVWEGLRKQTEARFEWIVIDDGSVDGTGEWIAGLADPRIRYVRQDNQGMHAARNAGMGLAKGRYTIYHDSDDELYDSDTLALMVSDFESTPKDIGLIWYRIVDEKTGKPTDSVVRDRLVTTFADNVCEKYPGDYFCIERNAVTRKYPWPPWRNPETDRWWSILREYNAMIRTRSALVYHWDGGDNMSDFSGMLRHSTNVANAYRELVEKYEDDWKRLCPRQTGKYNFYLAGYEVISGNWATPIPPIIRAFRHGSARTRIASLVLLICIPLPRQVCARLLAFRNWNRTRRRRTA